MPRLTSIPLILALTVAGPIAPGAETVADEGRGVVVYEVQPMGAADCAALREGDVLLHWNQPGHRGSFRSPFDVQALTVGHALQDATDVTLLRDGQELRMTLPPDRWKVRTAPTTMDLESIRRLEEVPSAEIVEAVEKWIAAVRELAPDDALLATWATYHAGDLLALRRKPEKAAAWFAEALRLATAAELVVPRAIILDSWAQTLRSMHEPEEARIRALEAAAAWRAADPENLAVIVSLQNAGRASIELARFDEASASLHQALDVTERLAPGSLAEASVRNTLAVLASRQYRVDWVQEFFESALAIRERLVPGSATHSESLNNMGALYQMRGDLASARTYYERSLAIDQRLDPFGEGTIGPLTNLTDSCRGLGDLERAEAYGRLGLATAKRLLRPGLHLTYVISNLAKVLTDLGNYAEAETLFRQALEMRREVAKDPAQIAGALNSLGAFLVIRGDYRGAEEAYYEALEITDRVGLGSGAQPITLTSLGGLALVRGDLDAAERYIRRSLDAVETLAPKSLERAEALHELANLSKQLGDLERADELARESLGILQEISPESHLAAEVMTGVGSIAAARGDHEAAARDFDAAIKLLAAHFPHSAGIVAVEAEAGLSALEAGELERAERLAESAITAIPRYPTAPAEPAPYRLAARLARRAGDHELALERYEQAIAAAEQARSRVAASGRTVWGFGAQGLETHREVIDYLIDRGLDERAFEVAEAMRARAQLDLIGSRDMVLHEVPRELDLERRKLVAAYERTQTELDALGPDANQDTVAAVTGRLAVLRDRREAVTAEIRAEAPRAAAASAPRVVTAEEAASALDPGTVMLSYVVLEGSSIVFVVEPGTPVRAFRLEPGREDLAGRVRVLRELIAARDAAAPGSVEAAADALYAALVKPVEDQVASATRILVSPDGPLHTLPFAALGRTLEGGDHQYLVEWKPIHLVASASLYARLRASRRDRPGVRRVVAFGDPTYPTPASGDAIKFERPQLASLLTRGAALQPLPATRAEVKAVGALWQDRATIFTGVQATEAALRSAVRDADVIHLACHAAIDNRIPLSSALALTPPSEPTAENDGFLEAWEIFEGLTLDDALVVLSACDTALGSEVDGEGLVGLTQAFQHAGARAVVASLWAVGDASTADLMRRFHQGLASGLSAEDALQRAQIAALRGEPAPPDEADHRPPTTPGDPFAWAGFQLYGDWQ